jgi:hypothetical protein
MDRTTAVTVAVVLLAVVAGCSGPSDGGPATGDPPATASPTPTATQTQTQTQTPTATSTATDGAVAYPEGWGEDGVTDADVATRTHYRTVLGGPSVAVEYRSRVLETTNNESTNTTLDLRLDPPRQRLHARIDGTERHREVFFADGTLTRWNVENETVLGQSDAEFLRVAQSIDLGVLKSQLLLYRLEPNRTVEREGTDAIVYDVAGVYGNAVSRSFGSPESATGRVVVSENGRVLDVDTRVTYTDGTVDYTYTQRNVGGTDVNQPPWL